MHGVMLTARINQPATLGCPLHESRKLPRTRGVILSQRRLVASGLLIGVAVGMVYSAYQSVKGVSSPFKRKVEGTGTHVISDDTSQLIAAGILEGVTGQKSPAANPILSHDIPSLPVVVAEPLPRVCGSPAIDGYANVDPACLLNSPTAKAWFQLHPEGGKSGEDLECNTEHALSIDGLAVCWGLTNKKASPEECCQSCRDHVPGPHVGGPFEKLPCNAWVYCPDELCFEADIHTHTKGDCWLKFTEAPQLAEINARGNFSMEFRAQHPTAPLRTQWISGVLLPPGQILTNGTWGPRASW